MGQSKIPLYAYVDETGNTGHNLFDEAQPDFFTAALITKGNFDDGHSEAALKLTASLGVDSLHGKELGVGRIEKIADEFLALLKKAQAHFFISRVEKKYLLVTKLYDSLFDSGENAGVAWHHYNLRPLRLLLAFKLALTIDEETARLFWQCILEPNEAKAYEVLPGICARLHGNLLEVPDQKSREVLGEGLEWARLHPKAIQIHTDRKLSRQAHFPNLVAFANLLDGLDHFSKLYKKRVARITHDQQTEFAKSLAAFHELFTTAAPDQIRWAGETFSLQKVVGSEFEVKADDKSAGIQVTDVVLWLYSQFRKQRELPAKCTAIVRYAIVHGWESDFSFSGVDRVMQERYGKVFNTPLTPEQEAQARELIAKAEENRLSAMAQYDKDGLPPFMRDAVAVEAIPAQAIEAK
ncbi:hypothetical protein ACVWZZ_004170 [Bradyrhizobium sp. LM6.10]